MLQLTYWLPLSTSKAAPALLLAVEPLSSKLEPTSDPDIIWSPAVFTSVPLLREDIVPPVLRFRPLDW